MQSMSGTLMGFSKWYFWVVKQNGAFKKGQNAFRETELSTSQLLFPEKFFGEMIERLNMQFVWLIMNIKLQM